MAPSKPLPYPSNFENENEYIDSLLHFAIHSTIFQTLCGGVHILDFFTREPSLYHKVIPSEWRSWLISCPSMTLLDLLLRDDLSLARDDSPPPSLITYIQSIRKHSLLRSLPPTGQNNSSSAAQLPRHIAVGMIPKKVHEVSNFASYVSSISSDISAKSGKEITHFVDFGSGQNYLGRTLASPPYNKHIVAVESKEGNIKGAKSMDVFAGVAEREKVRRNKKLFRLREAELSKGEGLGGKETTKRGKGDMVYKQEGEEADLRPIAELATIYTPSEGKGYIQYVEHRVQDGDLSDVVSQIENLKLAAAAPNLGLTIIKEPSSSFPSSSGDTNTEKVIEEVSKEEEIRLMAISIHSCGNLSHHGIRSLILNPSVYAIAIVGCCYNLLSERLSPPTLKHPLLRPNLRAINQPSSTPSIAVNDPHGFPMSSLLEKCNGGQGIPLNITARMMAVQAPANWTARESDSFFTRHFYRALLQKVFLDYGVVEKSAPSPSAGEGVGEGKKGECEEGPESTTPIIIGSLRKSCYSSFLTYVRGALLKLSQPNDLRGDLRELIHEKMGSITDEEIEGYERAYRERRKELSVTWSLMAFSAGVVESLIVVDRWLFLREAMERGEVREAWVESVFEYGLSPRNLVVVGIK